MRPLVQAAVKISTRCTDRRGPLDSTTIILPPAEWKAFMKFISIARHGAIVVGATLALAIAVYLAVLLNLFNP
jgi:hypothetical protein